MTPVRVLVINLHYPPHHVGGYEASCRDVVERLADRGHAPAVLTSSLRPPGATDPPGERTGPIPVWRDLTAYLRADGELASPRLHQRWRIERSNQRALLQAIERHRPDVVAIWQLGALSLGLVPTIVERGLPIVYAVCDDWLSYSLELDAWNRLFRRVPDRLARLASVVLRTPCHVPDLGATGPFLFVSEITRERARRYSPWSMPTTSVVHSGIDTTSFGSPRPDRPWGGRLLYAGRYDRRKGIETAIRALAEPGLEHCSLQVCAVGDAAERARLEAIVDELGLRPRVEFTWSPREKLGAAYKSADLVVFPSEWDEPFGLVPLEAMACGTPVAATGAGGSGRFCIDGENCVRFAPGDPAALAAAVRRVASDADLRQHLIDSGIRTAAAFDVDRLADTFEGWYRGEAPPEHDPLADLRKATP